MKKYGLLLLIFLITLCFVGCSIDYDSNNESIDQTESSTTISEETKTEITTQIEIVQTTEEKEQETTEASTQIDIVQTTEVSEEDTEEEVEASDNNMDQDDKSNDNSSPIIVQYSNLKNIKVGDYVSVTGPVNVYSTSGGKLQIGDNDSGSYSHCGIRVLVKNPDKPNTSYEVNADKVNPGNYEDAFKSHAPADFSEEPKTVGKNNYAGCRATITGTVEEVLITDEGGHLYGLELKSDAKVEYLEFFY